MWSLMARASPPTTVVDGRSCGRESSVNRKESSVTTGISRVSVWNQVVGRILQFGRVEMSSNHLGRGQNPAILICEFGEDVAHKAS